MKQQSGFTLIELSVVIAIIGVILYGSMSILITSVQTTQVNSTVATMDAIEKALLNFRVAFGRIPCPSDLTIIATNANYGIEAANTGSCTGGAPAANFIAASGTAEGGVPTRTLRLPDSYMFDGWGHKFRYAVNPNYTVTSSTSCSLSTNPAITVNDASGAARSTKAIYAIVSHGADGHGAYTSNGVVVNAGSTNADELTNCHCTSTGAANTYSPTYVQKYPTIATAGSPLTAFDDIVTYREFWQLMTPNLTSNALGCLFTGYTRTVTIDHTKVGTVNSTDQSSFPVLFSGTYSYLATTANGGNVNNTNGYDITFTSDAAGKNLLSFERESYNATTGAVTFWVQVPTVSHSTDTVIYLQYGNPNITTDQSNKNGVWDSNYMGVWHLGDNAANITVSDSTSNANNGMNTANTSTKTVTGQIDGALSYNGSSDKTTISNNISLANSPFTIEAWAKQTATPNGFLFTQNTNPSTDKLLLFGFRDTRTFACGFYGDDFTTTATYTDSNWHLWTCTYDASSKIRTVYQDAVSQSGTGAVASANYQGSATPSYIAYYSKSSSYAQANIDEVRISNIARSADWIKTEYNNQSAPDKAAYGASGFYTVGSQTGR